MFEDGTRVMMADGRSKDISELRANDYLMAEDGAPVKVTGVIKDSQSTYEIVHKTKHRAFEGEAATNDPLRKIIYQRLSFNCTLTHDLVLRTPAKPMIENDFTKNIYRVRYRTLDKVNTDDGRIINIPKQHKKYFKMTPEGKTDAENFRDEMERQCGEFLNYNLQVRDLDLMMPLLRITTYLRFSPLTSGNGVLSQFLTGTKHLNTKAVLQMAWMLGLWIGDGTTNEPQITVDSFDTSLIDALNENSKPWGIYPTYKDEAFASRCKHVSLHYGQEAGENRVYRNLRKNNPFWNVVTSLKFKRDGDGGKQIPTFMWSEDEEVREAFMAGLIDADGYVCKWTEKTGNLKVSIQTIYPSIMNGIVHISRSLGITATVTTRSSKTITIRGRQVQCQFTFDCNMYGSERLQNILSYCHSGHKTRPVPSTISRDPVYFTFLDIKKGINDVYGLTLEEDKNVLLENKTVVTMCTSQCKNEHFKIKPSKYLQHCIACPHKGIKYFYKNWSGTAKLCGRCWQRYKFSGYRCLNCNFVPEAREVKIAKAKGEGVGLTPEGVPVKGYFCRRCNGILKYDGVRGPKRTKEETSRKAKVTSVGNIQ
ncbi:hypothetical protein TPHA_0O01760 [Tetrapisispora phaffii CBS 4417]|uniref:DOD-type homing endonuclease domain-containing protein n=1 Tax=Tetrapisispora phaffii (strain ATCC 24235 / CBS 4417 / NBRC 1672 / NRRL Y-8282 / UCD 70-5) TaxID=1071381 RepID=G8C1W5_TETPH|nr:hypothetical protein TPHA_0O01760 [Tetrapisispora phaffii CBS 4417]CCE66143.1 hypothetical protein TPHA_0O01760 [Tetrapisispora phaffii CBS 4417]